MDDLIQDEVKDFVGHLEQNLRKPISMRCKFHIPILSALWTIVTGERASTSDSKMVRAIELLQLGFEVNDINLESVNIL